MLDGLFRFFMQAQIGKTRQDRDQLLQAFRVQIAAILG